MAADSKTPAVNRYFGAPVTRIEDHGVETIGPVLVRTLVRGARRPGEAQREEHGGSDPHAHLEISPPEAGTYRRAGGAATRPPSWRPPADDGRPLS